MSDLYRGTCSACKHELPWLEEISYAVITDSGDLARLLDRYDTTVLAAHGLISDQDAGSQGRLVECCIAVCRDCGELSESRHVIYPVSASGCLRVPMVGIAAGFLTWYGSGSVVLGVLATPVAILLFVLVAEFLVRRRMRLEGSGSTWTVKDAPCRCRGEDPSRLIPLARAPGEERSFPCPACGKAAMNYETWQTLE